MYKVAITFLPNGYWVCHDVDDVASERCMCEQKKQSIWSRFDILSDYPRITVSVNTKPDLEAEKARKEFLKNIALPHVTDMSIKDSVLPLSEIAKHKGNTLPEIKKVIFNPPATIVFWKDGTKTVVKCKEGEEFSEWAGIALCLAKKLYGPNFHKIFKRHCSDPDKIEKSARISVSSQGAPIDVFYSFIDRRNKKCN